MPTFSQQSAHKPSWRITKAKGFTLIELICVIVILGCLAATAAPKFVDLKGSAARAVADGVAGNLASAMNMAYVKCLTVPGCNAVGTTNPVIDGKTYTFYNGWPNGAAAGSLGDIAQWIDTSGLTVVSIGFTTTRLQVTRASNPSSCYVDYVEALTVDHTPTITTVTTGC